MRAFITSIRHATATQSCSATCPGRSGGGLSWFARGLLCCWWALSPVLSAQAASLSGSFTTLPPGANINLTAEGLLDWAHWGMTGPEDFNHRANTSQQITNFTVIGEAEVLQFGDNATGYSWSDGTPVMEGNNETSGIYVSGQDIGFELSVPADTTVRTLKLYVGAYAARMKFEASLSDNSAPTYVETNFANESDGPNAVFTIGFAAGSSGQSLIIKFTVLEDLGGGNVTLQAAVLREAAPLIELVHPANGSIFYSSAKGIEIRASTLAPNSIPASAVHLFLNGVDVSANSLVAGTEVNRTLTFNGLSPDILYDGQVIVADDLGRGATNRFRFDTFSLAGSILIEAEDYNYSDGVCEGGSLTVNPTVGGRYQTNLTASGFAATGSIVGGLQSNGTRLGYVEAVGLPDVDYSDPTGTPGPYRSCDMIGTETSPDLPRDRHVSAGVSDYQVTDLQPDEWMNYTRAFGGRYHVYLRAAALAERTVRLERVLSDPSQPNQQTEVLGFFTVPRSGLLIALSYVTLADASGNPVALTLDGIQTLRLVAVDAQNDLDLNYFVLAPAASTAQSNLINPMMSGGNFSVSFQSESGFNYTLEMKVRLEDPSWQQLPPPVAGDGTLKTISRPASGATGFYRLVAQ